MRRTDYVEMVYFRSINSFNQKVFPVPIPFMSKMSPKQLLLMGMASLLAYSAYIGPAWHLAPISAFLVYVAAKERKALYPERHALALLRFFLARRGGGKRVVRGARKTRRDGLFVIPERFSPGRTPYGPEAARAAPRRVYAAKLGTPLSLEVTMYDSAGRLYPRTRADVVFDGKRYVAVSDSNGQFEIYPIVSSFGRKDLSVSVGGRRILVESFDVQRG
ncbi:MAG: hypothetical protein EB832_04385 [Thaumarchaeota archaeon S14]|nr:MAG: hypothetical protein EB832_04385 [Thaumarchaeota archaeon S14]